MLRWSVRILSCNPEVQDKVGEELDRVVGKGAEVTWEKKKDLPYTMAVIKVHYSLNQHRFKICCYFLKGLVKLLRFYI